MKLGQVSVKSSYMIISKKKNTYFEKIPQLTGVPREVFDVWMLQTKNFDKMTGVRPTLVFHLMPKRL